MDNYLFEDKNVYSVPWPWMSRPCIHTISGKSAVERQKIGLNQPLYGPSCDLCHKTSLLATCDNCTLAFGRTNRKVRGDICPLCLELGKPFLLRKCVCGQVLGSHHRTSCKDAHACNKRMYDNVMLLLFCLRNKLPKDMRRLVCISIMPSFFKVMNISILAKNAFSCAFMLANERLWFDNPADRGWCCYCRYRKIILPDL